MLIDILQLTMARPRKRANEKLFCVVSPWHDTLIWMWKQ